VFWFSLQLLSKTFLILRRIRRDIIINVHRSSCKVPLLLSDFNDTNILEKFSEQLKYHTGHTQNRYCCHILNITEFPRQNFERYSNIKFHDNPSSGSRVVPCGRTDRHVAANIRFPQCCEAPSQHILDGLRKTTINTYGLPVKWLV
jgi:hypothetical protein